MTSDTQEKIKTISSDIQELTKEVRGLKGWFAELFFGAQEVQNTAEGQKAAALKGGTADLKKRFTKSNQHTPFE